MGGSRAQRAREARREEEVGNLRCVDGMDAEALHFLRSLNPKLP